MRTSHHIHWIRVAVIANIIVCGVSSDLWAQAKPTPGRDSQGVAGSDVATRLDVTKLNQFLLLSDPDDKRPTTNLFEFALRERLLANQESNLLQPGYNPTQLLRAQRNYADAQLLIKTGRKEFDGLELDAAATYYNQALTKLERASAWPGSVATLTQTLDTLAIIHLLLDSERRARPYLQRLLTIAPSYQPDQKLYNPEMMRAFSRVVESQGTIGTVDVTITTIPSGAVVYWNDQLIGLSPQVVKNIKPGRHFARATLRGFDVTARQVDVKPNKANTVSLPLIQMPLDAGTRVVMTKAVATLGEPLSPEATAFVKSTGAQEILAFAATNEDPSTFRLVRYSNDGKVLQSSSAKVAPPQTVTAAYDVVDLLIKGLQGIDINAPASASNAPTMVKTSIGRLPPTQLLLAYAAYGLAGAAAITGGALGLVAYKDQGTFKKANQVTAAEMQQGIKTKALIADCSYIAAAVFAGAGLFLHLTYDPTVPPPTRVQTPATPAPTTPESPIKAAPAPKPQAPKLSLHLGIGSLTVRY